MATVFDTAAPAGPAPGTVPGEAAAELAVAELTGAGESESKSDRYLARRLAAAGADYKGVALTTFLLAAAVAGGAWLVLGVLVEHWFAPGGLSPLVRWAWLIVAVVAFASAAARWLLPLVRYRVNLVYAARAIEREHPELHNDLVNTVLVKAHPEATPEKVVRSLERRTAKQLAGVPAEAVIDRTMPLRLAVVLAALVGLAGVYEVAAPKSLLVSAARLVAPWLGWAAPSRVRIEEPRLSWRMPAEPANATDDADRRRLVVDDGAITFVRGRQLVVGADIRGLRRSETPAVLVAPLRADGSVDLAVPAWRVEMTRAQTGGRRMFAAILPDATRGLDQSIEVTIAAGDARSAPVRVKVIDAPTLLVREVRYAFPPYTRRPPETAAWQGDIRAVEGTEVTLVAESNQPLEDAWIDFDADGSRDLRFTKSAADLARVTKSFHVERTPDGSGPEHASYRLLFQPRAAEGAVREQVITDPLEHRIEVLADVAPEVAIQEPRESPIRVPPAAPVVVRVQAHDPDFALARVSIETRVQGGAAGPEIVLLEKEHSGMFRGGTQIVPERCGAGPGATLEYRAVAVDNRPKRPNITQSPWQTLRIDPSAPPRQPERPPAARNADRSGQQGESEQGGDAGQAVGQDRDGGDSKSEDRGRRGQDRQQTDASQQQSPAEGRKQDSQPGQKQERGEQDGQADGAQGGGQQKQPQDGAQAGNQNGQGQNQGQGAEQGQGVGAQGQRQGGSAQQSGKQQSGGNQAGGQQSGSEREAGGQSGGGKPGDAPGSNPADRGSGQQRGGSESQRGDARDTAVAADGTNDGEAMERILQHRREHADKGGERGGQESDQPQGPDAGRGNERRGEGEGGQPRDSRNGSQESGGDAEHDHAPCAGADGKPCGREGCPSCKGQSGGQAGGGRGDSRDGTQGTQPGANGTGAAGASSGERGGDTDAQRSADGQGRARDGGGRAGEGRDGATQEKDRAAPDGQPAGAAPSGAAGEQASDGAAGSDGAGNDTQAGGSRPGDQTRQGAGDGGQQGTGGEGAQHPDGKKAAPSDQPGNGAGQTGSGGWAGGDGTPPPDAARSPDGPAPAKKTEWGEQDLAHARNAADLAIEHLRREVEGGATDVLDRLGWTRDQARAFLDRWEAMRRLAASADPVERGEFERTMRSLGLRPDGVRSSRDVPTDVRGGQAEGRRSRPPADYQEQFKAYTQGTAGE